MAYIPQPKDVTNFIGSNLTPQTYSSEAMFRAPTPPQQQNFNPNGAQTPQASGPQQNTMPQTPNMFMSQPMGAQPMGAQPPQNNDILSYLSSMFGKQSAPNSMVRGLFGR